MIGASLGLISVDQVRAQDLDRVFAPRSPVGRNLEIVSLALQRLNDATKEGEWEVHSDLNTGNLRVAYGGKIGPLGASPIEAGEVFLQRFTDLLVPGSRTGAHGDWRQFRFLSQKTTPVGTRLVFQQLYAGHSLFHSKLTLLIEDGGTVTQIISSLKPLPEISFPKAIGEVDVIKSIRAAHNAEVSITEIERDTVVYPGPPVTLALRVLVEVDLASNVWEYLLDTSTGTILESNRLTADSVAESDETGRSSKKAVPTPPSAKSDSERFLQADVEPITVCPLSVNERNVVE